MTLIDKVKQAQEGDQTQILSLLIDFGYRKKGRWSGLLGKYDKLLWHGRVDFRNKDTRRFLQLYLADASIRRNLTWRYQDYKTTMKTQSMANYIQNNVQRHYAREELRQELVLLFIECLHKYEEQPHITFGGYLNNVFRYRVYNLLQKTVFKQDPLSFSDSLNEDEVSLDLNHLALERLFSPLQHREFDKDELGFFWINGLCSPIFKELTPFDRTILLSRYEKKETDISIAKRYGYHRNSIYLKRHEAINKIKREMST